MKAVCKKILSVLSSVATVAVLALTVFTVIAVTTFDRQTQTFLGMRMFIVTSDSMKATDFAAGDLIFVKQVEPESLVPGDIISFYSEDPNNYGKTVTHKIRSIEKDAYGQLAFQTYGTSTNVDDTVPASENKLLGKYTMRLPGVGKFFYFLKTTPGYMLFVFLPFFILILYYGIKGYLQFRKYKDEEMKRLKEEYDSLEKEKQALLQLRLQEREGDNNEDKI